MSFWNKSAPSLHGLFVGRTLRNQLLVFLTPIVIWSNWWPYTSSLSHHNWGQHELEAKNYLSETMGEGGGGGYSVRSLYYSGILTLTINKQDSLLQMKWKKF
ncbi:hypothetical protein [Reichenbachiella sp. 5M10]|uniref:hypothetical protein n=1 Tax=Reichenbachiella sp. 5M10 TaxID=1889772 RepID=UPI00117A30C4|nr:hypothetical protein [Reichenbachiella sp. 5M10]